MTYVRRILTNLRRHFIPKQPPRASGTHSPRLHVFRITPDEIAKRALVRDLLCSGDDADLV
jgi:hypothetical protein